VENMRAREARQIAKKQRQYRTIYETLFENYRISVKDISSILGVQNATRRMQEAFQQQYIVGPEIRKRSYKNLKEYMYFVNCKDPDIVYPRYREDTTVIYHAVISGFSNFWVISKEKIDIEGDIILEGYRSDYHVAFAPNHSWDDTMQTIRKKVERFDPETYTPKGYIKTHFDESVEWDSKDELLYKYFKYYVRNPFTPLVKNYSISRDKFRNWQETLPECCSITTSYYPDKAQAYDHCLFMFETDYEDFIIDLFSEFPASSWFFKVSDKLFLYAHVRRKYIRSSNLLSAPNRSFIPLLGNKLLERGILKSKARASIEYDWGKDL
jgi:hypothetical protein